MPILFGDPLPHEEIAFPMSKDIEESRKAAMGMLIDRLDHSLYRRSFHHARLSMVNQVDYMSRASFSVLVWKP